MSIYIHRVIDSYRMELILFICLISFCCPLYADEKHISDELHRVERILTHRNMDSLRSLFVTNGRIYLGIKTFTPGYYSLEQTLAILERVFFRSNPLSFKVKTSTQIASSATAIGELRTQQKNGIVAMTTVLGFTLTQSRWYINRILLY